MSTEGCLTKLASIAFLLFVSIFSAPLSYSSTKKDCEKVIEENFTHIEEQLDEEVEVKLTYLTSLQAAKRRVFFIKQKKKIKKELLKVCEEVYKDEKKKS